MIARIVLLRTFEALGRGGRSLSGDSGSGCAFSASVLSSYRPQRCDSVPLAIFRNSFTHPPRCAVARPVAPVLDADRCRNCLWFIYQLFWTYYEVWLRTDVPDLCAADMILFLHIVPLMAALALRPHAPQDEYAARLRRLDFALMIVWWAYLYVLIVIPWQYVVADVAAYNGNLNWLYLIEKVAFLGTLLMAGKQGRLENFLCQSVRRQLYLRRQFSHRQLGHQPACLLQRKSLRHSPGSFHGLDHRNRSVDPRARTASRRPLHFHTHGVWLARLGMIAAFSLPLFAAWALIDAAIPARIRSFRLVSTLAAALLMGVMVFIRQRLLDRELIRLLTHSRDSFANLKRLQAQVTESEKLASIGQLVAGAAHELNNPITAMLGYSDLLLTTTLTPEQHELAARIGQHSRRTRSLVASLLSFAKQGPAAMAPIDLNALLRTAVKLSQPQWQGLKIEVRTELPPELLLVRGDSNQLLQVCVQIINDALHAVRPHSSRTLTIAAERKDGLGIITISHASVAQGSTGSESRNSAATETEEDQTLSGLGLNACQGILQQHHGQIFWQQDRSAGTTIRVEIPVIPAAAGKSTEAAVPVIWQPQPSA